MSTTIGTGAATVLADITRQPLAPVVSVTEDGIAGPFKTSGLPEGQNRALVVTGPAVRVETNGALRYPLTISSDAQFSG